MPIFWIRWGRSAWAKDFYLLSIFPACSWCIDPLISFSLRSGSSNLKKTGCWESCRSRIGFILCRFVAPERSSKRTKYPSGPELWTYLLSFLLTWISTPLFYRCMSHSMKFWCYCEIWLELNSKAAWWSILVSWDLLTKAFRSQLLS